jgi:DNA-binding transcriptional LysR family regulator
VLSSNNGDVLRQAAIKGMGVALLPTFIVGEAIATGQLVPVLQAWQPAPLLVSLLYAPNRHMAMRLSVFVKYIQTAFENAEFLLQG